MIIARQELSTLAGKQSLFNPHEDLIIDSFVDQIEQNQLQFVGPQLLLGPLYDSFGLADLELGMYFKALVISRLIYPGSKLKTLSYLKRHHQLEVEIDTIYRYLDHLDEATCARIQDQIFAYSRRILGGQTGLLFYDLTTLYFETSQEDELRRIGYSKDGKSQHPQIVLGLLLGSQGYPLAYKIFEGNTGEPRTLIPLIESLQKRYQITQPIIVADAALLSQKNIETLSKEGYQYIIGGRLKNEKETLQQQMLAMPIDESHPQQFIHPKGRLVVSYSAKIAKKDQANRKKGLQRLEHKIKSGKLSKAHLNNRGYNKYLKMQGEVNIQLDYQKFEQDKCWEGLKGYITNTALSPKTVIDQYSQL
ncbi:MAG: IS1634 family transposase [Bacteroidota bacterium]